MPAGWRPCIHTFQVAKQLNPSWPDAPLTNRLQEQRTHCRELPLIQSCRGQDTMGDRLPMESQPEDVAGRSGRRKKHSSGKHKHLWEYTSVGSASIYPGLEVGLTTTPLGHVASAANYPQDGWQGNFYLEPKVTNKMR